MSKNDVTTDKKNRSPLLTLYFTLSLLVAFGFFFRDALQDVFGFAFVLILFTSFTQPLSSLSENFGISPHFSPAFSHLAVLALVTAGIASFSLYSDQLNSIAASFLGIAGSYPGDAAKYVFFKLFTPSAQSFAEQSYIFTFILPLAVSYMLAKRRFAVRRIFLRLLSVFKVRGSKFVNRAMDSFPAAAKAFNKTLFLRVIGGLLTALVSFFGFCVLRVPNAFALAAVSGISAIIPYLGGIIGAATAAIYVWPMHPAYVVGVLSVIAVSALLRILLAYRLDLRTEPESVRLSPLTCIVITLLAFKITGAAGILLAAPIFVFLKTLFSPFLFNVSLKSDRASQCNTDL